jgi:putative endonuclease
MDGKRKIGDHYEGVAARYLISHGVRILARNVYNRGGEIDLIGQDGTTLVFFEVRYRRAGSLVGAAESITWRKQQRLIQAARYYLHRHQLSNTDSRIDVIAIGPGSLKKYRVHWLKNALQAG